MDELIRLTEQEAVRTFFDARNARVLSRLLIFFAAVSVFLSFVILAEKQTGLLIVPVISWVLIGVLRKLRHHAFFTRHCPSLVVGYLVAQSLLFLFVAWVWLPETTLYPWPVFALAVPIVFFRLPTPALAVPLTVLWAVSAGRDLVQAALPDQRFHYGPFIGMSVLVLVVLTFTSSLTRRMRIAFLVDWRREHRRHREQLRMREEIDDARKIQLSMLPASDPRVPWLDIASISIPASEVGGDYYDFFPLGSNRLAVVIGDVAGHGLASGLQLSAVRACLYLLHDSWLEGMALTPLGILEKLDRVVRRTNSRRQFVTLFYALFDAAERTLRYTSAGHPQVLHLRSGTRRIEELGAPALPLGTALERRSEEGTVTLEPGDVFVFITDGIAETTSSRGDVYGNERLLHRLGHTPQERGAKEIRDTLLGDVWSFKGDAEQTDDITLVVVKIR